MTIKDLGENTEASINFDITNGYQDLILKKTDIEGKIVKGRVFITYRGFSFVTSSEISKTWTINRIYDSKKPSW